MKYSSLTLRVLRKKTRTETIISTWKRKEIKYVSGSKLLDW